MMLQNSPKRFGNLDLFRILCMFAIMTLHFLGVSGAFSNINDGDLSGLTVNYCFATFVEGLCISGVNGFLLLSGYFLINSKFKWSRFVDLILIVLFYSIIIGMSVYFFNKESLSFLEYCKIFFPIIMSTYWFMTAYIVLYLFSPYLNKLIKSMSIKEFQILIILLLAIFSLWKTLVPIAETLDTTKGYGIVWFIVLYFVGAYIKLYYNPKHKSSVYFFLFFMVVVIIFSSKLLLIWLSSKYILFAEPQNIFYHYNSVPVFAAAVLLFLGFIQLNNIQESRILFYASRATLGVYLIHDNFLFREILWLDIIHSDKLFLTSFFPLLIFPCIALVFVLCVCIDISRETCFTKIKRVASSRIQR